MNEDTAAIANAILSRALAGQWLDIGCGPLLSIWPLFSVSPVDVFGLDRNSEVREYHHRLLHLPAEELPSDVSEAYGAAHSFRLEHGLSPITDPQSLVRDIRIQNLLEPILSWECKFDTVVQIGCFGCLDSVNDLGLALQLVHYYLKPGGVFISATWIPLPSYTESSVWGGDNLRSLDADTFISALQGAGLEVVLADCSELNDSQYNSRFVIEARKPPLNKPPSCPG
jgi:SAM-dependent methyltransferase